MAVSLQAAALKYCQGVGGRQAAGLPLPKKEPGMDGSLAERRPQEQEVAFFLSRKSFRNLGGWRTAGFTNP